MILFCDFLLCDVITQWLRPFRFLLQAICLLHNSEKCKYVWEYEVWYVGKL